MERATFSCPLFFQYNDELCVSFFLYVGCRIYKKECVKRKVTKFIFLYFYGSGWLEAHKPGTHIHTQSSCHTAWGRVMWQRLAGAVKWDSPPGIHPKRGSPGPGGTPICMIRLLHLSKRKPTSDRCRERTALRAEKAMQGPPPEFAFPATTEGSQPLGFWRKASGTWG